MEQQYLIERCKSDVSFLLKEDAFETNIRKFSNAKAIVWYFNKIVFYNIADSIWSQDLGAWNDIVRLRLFDQDQELHIWRGNNCLKGRLRVDSSGNETEFATAHQLLNGTTHEVNKDGIISTEEKGTKFFLPYPELKAIIGLNDRIDLITRNYIGYSQAGQASFVDARFVNIEIYRQKN